MNMTHIVITQQNPASTTGRTKVYTLPAITAIPLLVSDESIEAKIHGNQMPVEHQDLRVLVTVESAATQ